MKIKLRDLTLEQYRKWKGQNCWTNKILCDDCPFTYCSCELGDYGLWFSHKDMFSDKFLDQEIEIETEEEE